ncbi:MAG: hypothetical protein IKW28_09735 [Lachnospiraceae bacterium]|nr:hypothetical protein [Lachnospiraceae bacterium]
MKKLKKIEEKIENDFISLKKIIRNFEEGNLKKVNNIFRRKKYFYNKK